MHRVYGKLNPLKLAEKIFRGNQLLDKSDMKQQVHIRQRDKLKLDPSKQMPGESIQVRKLPYKQEPI